MNLKLADLPTVPTMCQSATSSTNNERANLKYAPHIEIWKDRSTYRAYLDVVP